MAAPTAASTLPDFLASSSSKSPEFCLNIRVQNKKDIVKQQVTERFGQDWHGPEGILTLAQKIANDLVTAERVYREVAENVVKDIPIELLKKGIKASATCTFRKGCFFVVTVKVLAADYAKLAAAGMMSRPVLSVLQCFEFMPACFSGPLFTYVLQEVAEGMLREMPAEVLSDLAAKGGVEATVTALPPSKEAEFLFQTLADIEREEAAAAKEKKPDLAKVVQDFTGKEEYKFGDITKTLIHKKMEWARSLKAQRRARREERRRGAAAPPDSEEELLHAAPSSEVSPRHSERSEHSGGRATERPEDRLANGRYQFGDITRVLIHKAKQDKKARRMLRDDGGHGGRLRKAATEQLPDNLSMATV